MGGYAVKINQSIILNDDLLRLAVAFVAANRIKTNNESMIIIIWNLRWACFNLI